MALGSTQPVTEMSTRCVSWGKGGRCVRLTTLPPSCAVVIKSGNRNFLEPSGPIQACNGTALPLLYMQEAGNFDTPIGTIPPNNYAPAKSLSKLLESPNKNIPFNTRFMKAMPLCKDLTLKRKASLSEPFCPFLFKDVSTGKIFRQVLPT